MRAKPSGAVRPQVLEGICDVHFFMDYTEFQLETNDGLSIQIQNAADMESKGIELDGTFLLTENLDVRVAYAYLDAEYKSGAPLAVRGQGRLLRVEASYRF